MDITAFLRNTVAREIGWKVAIVWESGLAQGVRADTIRDLLVFIRHPDTSSTRMVFPETPPDLPPKLPSL